MEDLEREIENLLKFADGTEFHRQQLVGGKYTDEVNGLANFRKEEIRRYIKDMIQKYTYKLENQIYKEVNESNSKYVKLRSVVVFIIGIGVGLLISFIF